MEKSKQENVPASDGMEEIAGGRPPASQSLLPRAEDVVGRQHPMSLSTRRGICVAVAITGTHTEDYAETCIRMVFVNFFLSGNGQMGEENKRNRAMHEGRPGRTDGRTAAGAGKPRPTKFG